MLTDNNHWFISSLVGGHPNANKSQEFLKEVNQLKVGESITNRIIDPTPFTIPDLPDTNLPYTPTISEANFMASQVREPSGERRIVVDFDTDVTLTIEKITYLGDNEIMAEGRKVYFKSYAIKGKIEGYDSTHTKYAVVNFEMVDDKDNPKNLAKKFKELIKK